eukprot:TRINITY_DN45464_c0_g2_i2.p1 TRINITY_DN45464_c0_g2~~TRINITY_DN45464_c0_g2_i2.p1  ORF type:complete len:315 (+),score=94.33 TRINITY_DN45464_c0_g2_i2:98-946(+)
MCIRDRYQRRVRDRLLLVMAVYTLLLLALALPISTAVDMNIFSSLRPEIFKGAPSDKPRTSYLPDHPPRLRVFKNGVLQANPYEEEEEDRTDEQQEKDFKGFWGRIDLDNDKVLSMDEFVKSMELPVQDGKMTKEDLPEMFNEADSDGSGELDFDEVKAFLFKDKKQEGQQGQPGSGSPDDPVVKESESIQGNDERFDQFWGSLDTDGNGLLGREEFEMSMRGAVESGHMPKDEMIKMYARMDANGDGLVSKQEAKAEIRAQMQQKQGGQQQGHAKDFRDEV